MAEERWFLGLRPNRLFIFSARPPIRKPNDSTGEMELYLDPGDCGVNPMCPQVAFREWPDVASVLRPLDYQEVTLPVGCGVGEVFRYHEVPK